MPRGKVLSEFEKGKIVALHSSGKSINHISATIRRSRDVVRKYINNPEGYGSRKRSGRPSSLSSHDRRSILRAASNRNISANQIQAELNIPASKWTIGRVLRSSSHLQYSKKKPKPSLKDHHKTARVAWAKEKMSWTTEWREIVFSDEKKFNLDGPDGYQYYWHDIRKEEQIYSKRIQGGGSVMIWAAFGWKGKTEIAFVNGRINAAAYQRVLEEHLLPSARKISGANWKFQQDNAPIHAATSTKHWFASKNITVIDWPALSPDLNPIENLWGILSRRVYLNGRQFQSVDELKSAIAEEWQKITVKELQNLINSMPNRVFEVISKHGNSIDK